MAGLRDRALLSVGLQVGLRRAEIAALKVLFAVFSPRLSAGTHLRVKGRLLDSLSRRGSASALLFSKAVLSDNS
jgi:hypothetical protein